MSGFFSAKRKLEILRKTLAVFTAVSLVFQTGAVFFSPTVVNNPQASTGLVCLEDSAGANDEPGQKDLTKMCVNYDNLPDEIFVSWNWDKTGWTGNNSGDGCSLYDTDGDGLANYSLCVVIKGTPASFDSQVLYSCGDDSAYKCTNPINVLTITGSSCGASVLADDPFPTGESYPNDTQAQCTVDMDDVGGVGVAELVDVCSYPSSEPNSDPSDCIIYRPRTGKLEVRKVLDPISDSGLFNLQIDQVTHASDVGHGGTTGEQVLDIGTYTVGETAGTSTNLNHYSTSIVCRDLNGSGSIVAETSGTGPLPVELELDDDIVCTITNTLQPGKLKIIKNTTGGDDTFNFSITGPTPSTPSILTSGGTGETGFLSVDSGTYAISETIPSGWHLSNASCANAAGAPVGIFSTDTVSNVTVGPNDEITCTFNDVKKGKIIVEKQTDPDSASGNFTFTSDVVGSISDDQQLTVSDLLPGTYTSTENDPTPEYDLTSIVCDDTDSTGDVQTRTATFNLQAGETITCVFTNTQRGSITGTKYEVEEDGTIIGTLSGWIIKFWNGVDWIVTTTDAVGDYLFDNLTAGVYTIVEDLETGWTQIFGPAPVTLNPGENSTGNDFGNFENLDVVICKYVDENGDGDITSDPFYAGGWEVSLDGNTQTTGEDGCTTFTNVGPGNYDVTEEVKLGWTQTYPASGSYNFDAVSGQDETFNFGNFENVSVTACKLVDVDGDLQTTGDQTLYQGWTVKLLIDGQINDTQLTEEDGCYTWTGLGPDHTYGVAEDVPSGWAALTPTSHDFGRSLSGQTYSHTFINFRLPFTIKAYKVVCEDEADLPNWGLQPGQPAPITANTAQDWVNSHPGCHLEPNWNFQWGPSSVSNPGDNTGEAAPATGWTTFGPTDGSGQATVVVDYSETNRLWFREVWQDNYIPFTYGIAGDDSDNVSAEFYCHGDVYHYDNYDYIQNPEPGQTYYCVAFNTINYGSISGHKWEDVDASTSWDAGEPALNGWTIFLDENGNKTLDASEVSTTTSGGGLYSFPNLVPGDYDVCEVLEPGWTRTLPGVGLDCYYLTVLPGQNLIDNDFGNFENVSVQACKYEDGDADLGTGNDRTFLPGWQVSLLVDGVIADTQPTGDNGCYRWEDLPPGHTYGVLEELPPGWTSLRATQYDFGLAQSGQEYHYDFVNFRNINITVCKYVDVNGDGDLTGDPPYTEGWEVYLDGSPQTTGEDGCTTFENVGPGNYDVTEEVKAGWTQTYPTSDSYNFDAFSGQDKVFDFGNFKPGEITICKYDDLNGNGFLDQGEPGIGGVTIALQKTCGGGCLVTQIEVNDLHTFKTEEGGCLTFPELSYGTYLITELVPEGYYPTFPLDPNSHQVSVESGTDETVIFLNARYGSIGDYIWEDADGDKIQDPGEKGISGVEVNLYLDGALVATQITDANGGYLFNNLQAGDYVVDVVESTVPVKFFLTTANDPMAIALDPGEVELGADFGYKKREGEVLAATGLFSPVNLLLALLALGLGIILRSYSPRPRQTR